MLQDIERVLISEEELQKRIGELGQQLAKDYDGKDPIFVGVLKGVVNFFTDMVRATPIRCQYEFMAVSSYGGGTSTSGNVKMLKDVSCNIKGRHVVILEDIIDSGLTLKFVAEHLRSMEPASLKICTLLDKPERRKVDIFADYVGFTIPNEFVVGFGLDYQEFYRNLPFIGVLKPEVYSK
ncbi:MAG: hypoxanthine phosphoribosyltransferase [Candidatus Faecousia sp.]|jgi:hypoxanthine phosphoribosyltransferase|uniref:hypoxanthine phosphoribosyltransferase n=1 Tax=Faecousia sp. TaxID=2952921 RepID=UPI002A8704B9|nr:hypoxanthine phosphoribosyltransferase [Candidatus Faecousia sp.]